MDVVRSEIVLAVLSSTLPAYHSMGVRTVLSSLQNRISVGSISGASVQVVLTTSDPLTETATLYVTVDPETEALRPNSTGDWRRNAASKERVLLTVVDPSTKWNWSCLVDGSKDASMYFVLDCQRVQMGAAEGLLVSV